MPAVTYAGRMPALITSEFGAFKTEIRLLHKIRGDGAILPLQCVCEVMRHVSIVLPSIIADY